LNNRPQDKPERKPVEDYAEKSKDSENDNRLHGMKADKFIIRLDKEEYQGCNPPQDITQ
jgi:hypothetical protein